jgi:hypothetical protein
MSWTGESRFHCEMTNEAPGWDPPKPVRDDYPEPDYFAEAVKRARKQAESVTDPEKRRELLECLREVEGIGKGERP